MSQQALETRAEALAQDLEAHAEPAAPARASWIVPAIMGSSLMLLTLESTIMANALPSIARAFAEEPLRLNMAMTMFLLASAVCLPLSGWLADKFGSVRLLTASMLLFAFSSIACGFSQSLTQLVIGRMMQGASAAMLMPVGRLVLLRTTPRHELVGALSILTIPPMIGPLFGPVLGGFIVTYFNWRWIFFINPPVAVICIVLMRAFVPNVKEDTVSPIDVRGVLLTGGGLACLVFGFENLGRPMLPGTAIAALFAASVACFALYWRHARGNPHAIIDLSIFRIRTFNTAIVGGAFSRIGIGAMPFLLAMLLQIGFGMTAFAAGGLTFISGFGALFMKSLTPPILRRFGFRTVLVADTVLVAFSFLPFGFVNPGTSRWALMAILGIGSFFRSLQFTSMNALTFADLEPAQMSRASATSSMVQQLVQSVGIGLAALLLHGLELARHETHLTWQVVRPAMMVVGGVNLLSLFWFARLDPAAGEHLHRRPRG